MFTTFLARDYLRSSPGNNVHEAEKPIRPFVLVHTKLSDMRHVVL